jgi:hypothetical protein
MKCSNAQKGVGILWYTKESVLCNPLPTKLLACWPLITSQPVCYPAQIHSISFFPVNRSHYRTALLDIRKIMFVNTLRLKIILTKKIAVDAKNDPQFLSL